MVKSKYATLCFDSIANLDRVIHDDPTAIHEAAISYYDKLLKTENHIVDDKLMSLIPRLVSDKENLDLLRPFLMEEAK